MQALHTGMVKKVVAPRPLCRKGASSVRGLPRGIVNPSSSVEGTISYEAFKTDRDATGIEADVSRTLTYAEFRTGLTFRDVWEMLVSRKYRRRHSRCWRGLAQASCDRNPGPRG